MTKTELNTQHLDWLEAESIHIIREVVAECENPALLFSGGKDSVVLLALARKAFQLGDRPVHLPFPLVHIDTGHNYPEVIQFRDEQMAKLNARLVVPLPKARWYYAKKRIRVMRHRRSLY